MRKLLTAFSVAIITSFGMVGNVAPSLADGGPRVVYEYPNPTISEEFFPVFASDEAWFKQGGTLAKDTTGVVARGSEKSTLSRDPSYCLANQDGDGEPKNPVLRSECL